MSVNTVSSQDIAFSQALASPLITIPAQLLQDLLQEVQSLREEVAQAREFGQNTLLQVVKAQAEEIQALKSILQAQAEREKSRESRLEELEALQVLYHGESPAPEERPALSEALQRQRQAQASLPSRVWSLEEDMETLEQEVHSRKETEPGGKKTQARVKQLKEILKKGSRTFKELQRQLSLSPSQFSKLLNHLDKRVFEIARRPGGKKGEKILGLKVRIMEL